MAAHAKLSASGSKQWINCPGSIAAEAKNPSPRGSSFFAQEGTAAHLLCEIYCTDDLHPQELLGETISIRAEDAYIERKLTVDDLTSDGRKVLDCEIEAEFIVDQEMIDAVEFFVAAVETSRARLDPRGREELSEQWIDMSWVHPLLGGTGDFIIVESFGYAELIDYKHGRGVLVEVMDNTQLKIYGTGVMQKFPDCEGIRMTIVQPRKEHEDGPIRSVDYTRAELMEFAEELREAAEATQKPNAPIRAGDHCTWCDGKAYTDENGAYVECPALQEYILESTGIDFADDPPEIGIQIPKNGEDLARAKRSAAAMDGYVRAVDGALLRELLAGRPVPGFKLVRKRANRKFGVFCEDVDELTGLVEEGWETLSEDDVFAIMESELGLTLDQCVMPGKFKSPAQFEKSGKAIKRLVGQIAYKPEGGLTVADESDPRPAEEIATGGADDFPDDLEE